MEIFKVNLRIRDCMDKEWMLSNGIGGYSMQTISGTNTRSYHGLLVAALNAPLNRNLILSNILEDVYINEKHYPLHTAMNSGYVSEGYKNMHSFKYKYGPVFEYKFEDAYIKKSIQMEHGKNAVYLIYEINAGKDDLYLDLKPLLNYRDFHSVNSNLDLYQEIKSTKQNEKSKDEENKNEKVSRDLKVKYNITNTNSYFNENSLRNINLYISSNADKYEFLNTKYEDMFFFREKERGFAFNEDLLMPGVFKVKVEKNKHKKIYIRASLEDENTSLNMLENIFEKEETRKKEIVKNVKLKVKENKNKEKVKGEKKEKSEEKKKIEEENKEFIEDLILATDYFLVKRDDKRSIIAGYPWFADWGRDSLISLEGLLLKTKRFKEAKSVLEKLGEDLCWGLIPNSYEEYTKKPMYNSADSSLLYVNALKTYLNYTNDEKYIKDSLKNVREIVKMYEVGTNYDENNIFEDEDGLIVAGTESTQNTWMDAKVGNMPVTPRSGKAVEMSALWYNALMVIAEFEEKYGEKEEAKRLNKKAEKTKKSFLKEFKSSKKGLKDLIDNEEVRPNQLFALWTNYPIVDPKSKLAKEILDIVDRRLRNRFGLKSLEKGYSYYTDEYSGDSFKRDMSYHQGITWIWLLELYYEGLKKRKEATKTKKDIERYESFVLETINTYKKNLYQKPCVMTINEINDSTFPYDGKGAVSQAWSVAAILKIVSE